MPFTTPLALLGPAVRPGGRRDVPAQAAARRDGRAVDAAVDAASSPTSRRTRRGRSSAGACCCSSSCCSSSSSRCSRPGRSWSGRPGWPATSSSSSTRRRAWARPTSRPNRLDGRQGGRDRRAHATCRPAARSASSPRTGRARIVVNETTDLGRVRQAIDGDPRRPRAPATSATRSSSPGKLAARSGDAQVLVATDAALATVADGHVDAPVTVLPRRPRAARTRRSSRSPCGRRRRPSPGRSSSASPTSTCERADAPARGLGRRPAPRGRATSTLDAQARSDVVIDDVPRDVAVARGPARRTGRSPSDDVAPDQLAVDDRAWAIVPPDRARDDPRRRARATRILETALSLPPERRACSASRPTEYPADARRTGRLGLGPDHLRGRRAGDAAATSRSWPSRRPTTSPLGDGHRARSTNPGIGSLDPDEPILRYVDLSTTHIAEAAQLDAARRGRGP